MTEIQNDGYAQTSKEFLARAREELAQDDLLQASEKLWGAAAHMVKAVAQRRRWWILVGEVGFILRRNPDLVRAPDVAFLRRDRLPGGPSRGGFETRPYFLEMAADLIIEIVSPNDTPGEIRAKIRDWAEAGSPSSGADSSSTRSGPSNSSSNGSTACRSCPPACP